MSSVYPFRYVLSLRLFALVALLFLSSFSWPRMPVETLSAKHPTLGDYAEFRFPLVKGEAERARRINTWLQVSVLERFPGGPGKTPFDAVWPEEGEWTGVTSLDYQVLANTSGLLSIVFNGGYTGAYPSVFSQSYHFETHTGQPLFLTTLFTDAGMEALRKRVDQAQIRDIDALLGEKTPGLDEEEAQVQRELYQECRSNIEAGLYDEREWQLRPDALVVLRRCGFPHAVRALDDLGEQESRFDYETLKPGLNDYGRCLLLARREDCPLPRTGPRDGVFLGLIDDRFPITLVLGAWSGPGWYAYDKYQVPIRLHREAVKDDALRLTRHKDGEITETFTLRWADNGDLIGQWQQLGQPPLPVHLH